MGLKIGAAKIGVFIGCQRPKVDGFFDFVTSFKALIWQWLRRTLVRSVRYSANLILQLLLQRRRSGAEVKKQGF